MKALLALFLQGWSTATSSFKIPFQSTLYQLAHTIYFCILTCGYLYAWIQFYMLLCSATFGALKSLAFKWLCLSAVPGLFHWSVAKALKLPSTLRIVKPKVCFQVCFPSLHSNISGITIAAKLLLIRKLLVTPERGFRAHHCWVTKCWQPLENCSSEKQDGKLNCCGVRPRTFSGLLKVSPPSAAQGALRGTHSLASPDTQTLPSFRGATYPWVSSLSLPHAKSFHTCPNKVCAGQLLCTLHKLKFIAYKEVWPEEKNPETEIFSTANWNSKYFFPGLCLWNSTPK